MAFISGNGSDCLDLGWHGTFLFFFVLLWLSCPFVLRVFLFAGLVLTSFGWHGFCDPVLREVNGTGMDRYA